MYNQSQETENDEGRFDDEKDHFKCRTCSKVFRVKKSKSKRTNVTQKQELWILTSKKLAISKDRYDIWLLIYYLYCQALS